MDTVLALAIQAEPVERKFIKAMRASTIEARDYDRQVAEAIAEDVITQAEGDLLLKARSAAMEFIHVDDFDTADLRAGRGAHERPALRSVG